MRSAAPLLLLSGLLWLGAGCTPVLRAQSDRDPQQDLHAYVRYGWLSEEPPLTAATDANQLSPLNQRRIREAIAAELAAKGYERIDRPWADFLVSYTVGTRQRIEIEQPRRRWGERYFGRDIDASMYTEGTLAIDVFDAQTRQPVWHGWVKRPITDYDIKHADEQIPPAVKAVLERFPARGQRSR